MKKAFFAAGCFWCITPAFYDIAGVQKVTAGYSGGDEAAPTYEQVKGQMTGHRETICVEYNSDLTNFQDLMCVFIRNVDPFDDGGQFIDRGHSYTLAVYYTDKFERNIAENEVCKLEHDSGKKCGISVEAFTAFWTAEEYHQDYYRKYPEAYAREMEESGRSGFLGGGK